MRVLHLNHSDTSGGAARAAYRIHTALRNAGIDSRLWVDKRGSNDSSVEGPLTPFDRFLKEVRPRLANFVCSHLRGTSEGLISPALFDSNWPRRVNQSDADIVHLHWVQGEMLSVKDVARLKKPLVWTVHDMWPFCGATHYPDKDSWMIESKVRKRQQRDSLFDLDEWTLNRKLKYWKRPISLVANSSWTFDCISNSRLMSTWPRRVLFYPLDLEIWKPVPKPLAKNLVGISGEKFTIGFVAMGGTADQRKGFDLLLSSLDGLSPNDSRFTSLLVVGEGTPSKLPLCQNEIKYLGPMMDDLSLRIFYSACDVVVVPSRKEAFGQTASEAHACGTPVVAFNIGGLPDTVIHKVSGYLAEPFDVSDLATGINWVRGYGNSNVLSENARKQAESRFCAKSIAHEYELLYREVVERHT